jgi:putative CocE/NonD family hydrolase
MDKAIGRNLPAWRDWMSRPFGSPYWAGLSYQQALNKASAPALHVTSWYDDVQVGTLENFTTLTDPSRPAQDRASQHLIVGPWGHAINASRKLGDIDFGPDAVIDFDGAQLRWFDHWLKGIDNGVDREPPVRVFLMGANEWRSEDEWPIARTQYVKFFLHSSGKANSLTGDGRLARDPPAGETPDRFDYDPRDPVPFITEPTGKQVGGPDDYRQIEARRDVLVYTTEPVVTAYDICGPLRVKLFAASSARDTDWTAKILDVHPDGFAQRLNDGIVRARFSKGLDRERLLTPGAVESYDIDAWATCIRMQPGHRLRLEISSSAFPKFDRNLNTGRPIGTETRSVVASQTVHHDSTAASYLLVPIVPLKGSQR